jgi:hypothetical protein
MNEKEKKERAKRRIKTETYYKMDAENGVVKTQAMLDAWFPPDVMHYLGLEGAGDLVAEPYKDNMVRIYKKGEDPSRSIIMGVDKEKKYPMADY